MFIIKFLIFYYYLISNKLLLIAKYNSRGKGDNMGSHFIFCLIIFSYIQVNDMSNDY